MLVNTSLKERIEFPIIQHEKVIEKTLIYEKLSRRNCLPVLVIVPFGGPYWTVPELLFEKKGLICKIQQLIYSQLKN
jgi:hypothetical protein